MENTATENKLKNLRYTVMDGARYWHSYEEARLHPEKYSDGRIYRWRGKQDGTYVELRT